MEYISSSESETAVIAKKIAKTLKRGDIVLLEGDLGAGKTTLVKFLVKSLGSKDDVTSPTFTIVNEYKAKDVDIYHMDFYRIKSVDELYNIGIEEYLYGSGICLIEWPERAEELFNNCKRIKINKLPGTKRQFICEDYD